MANLNLNGIRFRIELNSPIKNENISKYWDRFSNNLLELTNSISLTSKTSFENELNLTGFDRNIFFLNSIDFKNLDILYHITCFDLNVANLNQRLNILKGLGIKHLLIVSGEDYDFSSMKNSSLYFRNSTELIKNIISNKEHESFFTIAIAGYPFSNELYNNNNDDYDSRSYQNCSKKLNDNNVDKKKIQINKLTEKISICKAKKVYTQCIMKAEIYETFRNDINKLMSKNQEIINIIPSVALFNDLNSYNRVMRLIRVGNHPNDVALFNSLNELNNNLEEQRKYCRKYLINLIKDLISLKPQEINICTFGLFEFAQEILNEIVHK